MRPLRWNSSKQRADMIVIYFLVSLMSSCTIGFFQTEQQEERVGEIDPKISRIVDHTEKLSQQSLKLSTANYVSYANSAKKKQANHTEQGDPKQGNYKNKKSLTIELSRKRFAQQETSQKTLVDKFQNIGKKIASLQKKSETKTEKYYSIEYPGQNKTGRENLLNLWRTYYDCLHNHTNFVPKAHYIFPGSTIKMTCEACLPPGGEVEVHWTLATMRTHNLEEELNKSQMKSAFKGNNRIDVRDRGLTLFIFGVNEKDAGNYSCKLHQSLMTVHLLQVAEKNESIRKVWPESSVKTPKTAPDITLQALGLTIFTKWQNWTSCSRCDQVGKRYRVGICTVGFSTTAYTNTPKLLTVFREGIPCRSKLLPRNIQTHPIVVSRMSEIMEAFCKEPCRAMGKYIVRSEKGEIVEEADNAKGIYSMAQKLPKLPPPVKRKIIFLKQWDTAHLQCPGSTLSDTPVRWFIGKQPIHSRGDRIYVTPTHMLTIEDLGLSDSNLYSCWQGSRLVGTLRLQVSQPVRLSFSQQVSYISMILIVITFVIIFGRAFCNTLRSVP